MDHGAIPPFHPYGNNQPHPTPPPTLACHLCHLQQSDLAGVSDVTAMDWANNATAHAHLNTEHVAAMFQRKPHLRAFIKNRSVGSSLQACLLATCGVWRWQLWRFSPAMPCLPRLAVSNLLGPPHSPHPLLSPACRAAYGEFLATFRCPSRGLSKDLRAACASLLLNLNLVMDPTGGWGKSNACLEV